jgi:hypothetical protein
MSLTEAVAGYEMIDTKEVPWQKRVPLGQIEWEGSLKVAYPYAMRNNERHFYLSCISDAIEDKFDPDHTDNEIRERIFNQLIEYDWSILGLSGVYKFTWFSISTARMRDCRHRWQPYLRKLCEFWDIFCGEGERYIGGGLFSTTLWEANDSLHGILYRLGVPDEEVDSPKDPTDLKGFCGKYNLLTIDALNNSEILKQFPLTE